jgi:hypothetical protein
MLTPQEFIHSLILDEGVPEKVHKISGAFGHSGVAKHSNQGRTVLNEIEKLSPEYQKT